MFTNALVRRPGRSITGGISQNPGLGKPDFRKAITQHDDYIHALQRCGVTVTVLPETESHPDGCFIEDVAIVTLKCAVITRPGADSRVGEITGMHDVLGEFYRDIGEIKAPGTLDGGDVMMVGEHFYIGISARTNHSGAHQLIQYLNDFGYTGSTIPLKKALHLKTGLAYLEDNILLVAKEISGSAEFDQFQKIGIPEAESYAANCIRVNDQVLIPAGYPKTRAAIEAAGLKTIPVDTSEFRKLDGGLSCLSLRF
ncbi:MAG: N(G),N(G)-dimethylarginine dimethylaminohydrolase [Desulfobacteraceae bacterium]|nr:N(G),N(G)-dimethylarginine dimethylaminohydrolase [Desulfobacteraceae bacterium]